MTGGRSRAKYICVVCGYIYDPVLGDPERGIEPGTSFDDLPEDWLCPWCLMPKSMFRRLNEPKKKVRRRVRR